VELHSRAPEPTAGYVSGALEVDSMAVREGTSKLKELEGSGDNVLVLARVTHISELNTHKPYQKGLLWDSSLQTGDVRPFVVYDSDIRLEKGGYYVMNGTDYAYDPLEEIQLILGEGAYVKRLDQNK